LLGKELETITQTRNGKIDMSSPEILEFIANNKDKIDKQSDIYAVGAILYKLLLGKPPSHDIADYINKKRLNEKKPDSNVYEVPFFFKDYILSNDMCYILIRLLHQKPDCRF
jgi:serine/threonine protein kinase